MAVRGAALAVALIAVAAPIVAAAGEGGFSARVELLPLLPPPAAKRASPPSAPASQPVCVRLCDGFYFPLPPAATPIGDAEGVCRAVCPAAATAVYYLPGRSDRIEAAADAGGALYTALPAAFRYRAAATPGCGCRQNGDPGLAYWRDPTLRPGDAIMTPSGVVVFRGAVGGAPYRAEAFEPVDAAPLGATRRAELGALRPADAADEAASAGSGGIGEARRAAGAAGEIRFVDAPPRNGG